MTSELRVSQKDLVPAIRRVRRLAKSWKKAQALLTFDGKSLCVEIAGLRVGVAATGQWDGQARVDASVVEMIGGLAAEEDTLLLQVENDVLHVRNATGAFASPCVWQAPEQRVGLLLSGSPLPEVVRFAWTQTSDEIENAGLAAVVSDAVRKCDAMIERAGVTLAPLGVTTEDVRALVESKLKAKRKA